MLINPWIVLAEIFNFLILVALLQRFLYKPITQAMAAREKSIANRLASAETQAAEAQTQVEQYQQLKRQWAQQTQVRQSQMHQQIEAERATRLKDICAELEHQKSQWNMALRQEQKAALVALRDKARSQLIQSVRAALTMLANVTLEQQMVEMFLTRLPTLLPTDIESLRETVTSQGNAPKWTIRTAFPLDESLKQHLVKGIQTQISEQIPFDNFTFETYSDYPCGIELRIEGYKLAWHLEHYLDSLESKLTYELEQVPIF